MADKRLTRFRHASQNGMSFKWTIIELPDETFKIFSVGELTIMGSPYPIDFAPFNISNAVVNSPIFKTKDEAVEHIKSL